MSHVPGMESSTLREAMKIFERFLYSVNLENTVVTRQISSSRIVSHINYSAIKMFIEDFK